MEGFLLFAFCFLLLVVDDELLIVFYVYVKDIFLFFF